MTGNILLIDRQREDEWISQLTSEFRGRQWPLMPLLQAIQEKLGYIPPRHFRTIASALHLSPSQVQGVVSFYAQFYTQPKGRYLVRVCKGTSCHVRGGRQVLQAVQEVLGIREGETTQDNLFSLETVSCLGTCFLSPAMMVGKDYYGLLTTRRIPALIESYRTGKGESKGKI